MAIANTLDSGVHTFHFHMVKDTRMEISFDVSTDMVHEGTNTKIFTLNGATAVLNVKGTNDETELYNSPMNTDVTLIALLPMQPQQ